MFCQWSLQHLPLVPWSYANLVSVFAFSRKRQAVAPALAPRKALKVSTSSTAQWVVEAQAAIQRGVASMRANPKEPVAPEEATKVATKQAGEEAPTPCEAEARESSEAKAPTIVEATECEAESSLGGVEPSAQDAETGAGQALVRPPVQDPPPL